MTKGYPNFEQSPGIPITDKDYQTQSEGNEIYSTHEDEHDDDIPENGEEKEIIEEDTYKYEHPSDRENDPCNEIILPI